MNNRECNYEFVKKRVKNMSIRVRADGSVIVTVPYAMSKKRAEEFAESRRAWIEKKQSQVAERTVLHVDSLTWNPEKENVLREIMAEQYERFASYGIAFPFLKFRKMKSRYGSCNTVTKVVTLNKVLADMPRECAEYVAAHELAHLIEPNHGRAFYQVLDSVMPEHRIREKRLREYALHN